jgi:hypothetical protein
MKKSAKLKSAWALLEEKDDKKAAILFVLFDLSSNKSTQLSFD